MRKSVCISVALLGVLLLAACRIDINSGGGRKIEPSSLVVRNEQRLAAFSQLDVEVTANVKIVQGRAGDCRVVLSCPENYVGLFRFDVKDDELDISFSREGVNIEATDVDITVYTPTLRKVENGGVASIEADRLTADRLEVENSGVGGIYLAGLKVARLTADCSGVGSIELGGEATEARLDCSGVGSIRAAGLRALTVKADVSGVGGIDCHATERIDGEVSGVGSLKYGGNPQQKNLRRTGVGDIKEL